MADEIDDIPDWARERAVSIVDAAGLPMGSHRTALQIRIARALVDVAERVREAAARECDDFANAHPTGEARDNAATWCASYIRALDLADVMGGE